MGQAQFSGKNYQLAASYGSIYVKPDHPHYYAGENMTRRIYLQINMPYPGLSVKLKIKGTERTTIIWTEQV